MAHKRIRQLAKRKKRKSIKITLITKRNGATVSFDRARIELAVEKALRATGEYLIEIPIVIADAVIADLKRIHIDEKGFIPHVEEIQDTVEKQLILHKFSKTAKAYILYRERHANLRRLRGEIPEEVRRLVSESKRYFPNTLSEFVYYTTYARWLPEEARRETWIETIDRYISFMRENIGDKLSEKEYGHIRDYMLHMKTLGSMRLLWSAGRATRASNVTAYNCSFIAPTEWKDFGEMMYVSMCGTGLGFSVERQHIELLPVIKRQTGKKLPTHVIPDSREGWADSLIAGMNAWEEGNDITFDYSQIRPRGARLHTMGGRASGPEPLQSLHEFVRETMLVSQNRRLRPIQVHDIICKIGEIVVAGGVRRSALISLSDIDDVDLREAKNGQFYLNHPERSMANNSVVYNEKPSLALFLDEWSNLVKSGSGERGIYNRGSLKKQIPARRWPIFEPDLWSSGVNPCGEICLKSKQFCNLTEVVARADDTEDSLIGKIKVATILGTYQATLTNFSYLSSEWKKNCEEEALLGVSITGQWDCPALRNASTLNKLREVAIKTNQEYARRFGINPATAITCVKPSGNTSQLVNASSGMHPRHAPYYIRRVRIQSHDPLFTMLKDMGVPYHPEVGQAEDSATTYVVEFPVAAPEYAVLKDDLTSLDQLSYWKMVKENYTEHNPSTTISVGEGEWLQVASWVYDNWDMIGGLSFLPRLNHIYRLAPYEEISREKYNELVANFPAIDFSKVYLYEQDDNTTGAKQYACVAGTCEIDIQSPVPQTVF